MNSFESFTLVGEPQNQGQMAHYMRDQFLFLGAKTPARKAQARELLKQSKQMQPAMVLSEASLLYQRPEREYQYVAIDLCVANVKRFDFSQIKELSQFVVQKSWWDSVDSWRKVFGLYVINRPAEKAAVFELFYQHANFWMRRISILLQLSEKKTVNQQLLTQAIEYDIKTDEFFIQKAIGWALRDYSKYNPEWVTNFIKNHELSKLAKFEGSKYI